MGVGEGLQVGATWGTLAALSSLPAPSQRNGIHGERKKPPLLSPSFRGGGGDSDPSQAPTPPCPSCGQAPGTNEVHLRQ